MDLLTVLSTCSLAKDFSLVLAMAMAFSQGEPLTVRAAADVDDAVLDDTSFEDDDQGPRTREVARAEMRRFKQPVVGLLPVPIAWAARYQHAPDDLLDACVGVSVATAQLSEFERACVGRSGRRARECVLHAYAEAADIPLFELAVLDALQAQHPSSNAADVVIETEEILGAGLFASEVPEPVQGPNRVLVSVDPPPPPEKKPEPPTARKDDKKRKPHEPSSERR